jgi:hypothetical protein
MNNENFQTFLDDKQLESRNNLKSLMNTENRNVA